MLKKVSVPITGLVLNQSYYLCNDCDSPKPQYLFGKPSAGVDLPLSKSNIRQARRVQIRRRASAGTRSWGASARPGCQRECGRRIPVRPCRKIRKRSGGRPVERVDDWSGRTSCLCSRIEINDIWFLALLPGKTIYQRPASTRLLRPLNSTLLTQTYTKGSGDLMDVRL